MSAFILPAPPLPLVEGLQATSSGTFLRVGTVEIASPGSFLFVSRLGTSSALNPAEIRLFDLTAVAPVPGSLLASASTLGATVSAAVALGAGAFDVQLRLTTADPAERAIVTSSQLVAG